MENKEIERATLLNSFMKSCFEQMVKWVVELELVKVRKR